MELVTLRRNFVANGHQFNQELQVEFTGNCLLAIDKARPALEKHRSIAGLLVKLVLCLLIVPIFIFYAMGTLPLKTKSHKQIDNLESTLLSMSFFRRPAEVQEPVTGTLQQGVLAT